MHIFHTLAYIGGDVVVNCAFFSRSGTTFEFVYDSIVLLLHGCCGRNLLFVLLSFKLPCIYYDTAVLWAYPVCAIFVLHIALGKRLFCVCTPSLLWDSLYRNHVLFPTLLCTSWSHCPVVLHAGFCCCVFFLIGCPCCCFLHSVLLVSCIETQHNLSTWCIFKSIPTFVTVYIDLCPLLSCLIIRLSLLRPSFPAIHLLFCIPCYSISSRKWYSCTCTPVVRYPLFYMLKVH